MEPAQKVICTGLGKRERERAREGERERERREESELGPSLSFLAAKAGVFISRPLSRGPNRSIVFIGPPFGLPAHYHSPSTPGPERILERERERCWRAFTVSRQKPE